MGRRERESRLKKPKKITIKEVAKRAGVSPTTVSNVLHGNQEKVSESTAKKVRKVLGETGYEPSVGALLLAGNHSHVVTVLVGDRGGFEGNTGNQTAAYQMLGMIEKEITQRNYYMLLHFCDTAKEGVRFALTWKAEGMITIGMGAEENSLIKEKFQAPLVAFCGWENEEDDHTVACEGVQEKIHILITELFGMIEEKRKENKVARAKNYRVY
ncbi:MAG: LacI family transcriptional regulator [Coprococcus sp.]|nr:LacI family transcriptional regulator [Coprococcus sp.]